MNELQVFNNEDFGQVRTVEDNGDVLFCAGDVARALGYTNTKKAVSDHCDEDGVTFRSLTAPPRAASCLTRNLQRMGCSS